MDFSAALPVFAITLREGVEAALVVGIVMAYLKKADRTVLNPWVFGGIGTGVLASFVVGILLNWFLKQVESTEPNQAAFYGQLWQGLLGLTAIAMLSWMLVWMTENAKSLKGEIEGQIGKAIADEKTAGWAVFTLILIAVLREGFEVVIFISAKLQGGLVPIMGAIAGLVGAVAIGVALFQFGVRINLKVFFQAMGVFLLLIVAGLVISAIGHLDKAVAAFADLSQTAICFPTEAATSVSSCLLGGLVWDVHEMLPDKEFPGILLKALLGFRDRLFLGQAIAYFTFLASAGFLYFQSLADKSLSPNK
ncbi:MULTISPECIES: FTR1 family iron permease [Pseudanabaena]|uniref:FTR1 family iron permease n=1 Tax=Pseudanabaena TaxID=1152 RepID=UPI0024791ADA|nr:MULTISPECIES: FTR1 family protein [Pseudanabaena]MEA5489138.1 FTR1 family protein [Pseudanabaena sp. CCNP1317]WGS74557.1 FTR1 family protein [Pseudanabaena galeata CCNP1313]